MTNIEQNNLNDVHGRMLNNYILLILLKNIFISFLINAPEY
jgi:hypothetical protein